jgi:hypothetical protein
VLSRSHRTPNHGTPDHRAAAPRRRIAAGLGVGIAGFLTGVLIFFLLVGCSSPGSGTGTGTGTGVSQAGSARQQALTIWLDYARCVRAHGAPNFPDPVVDAQGRGSIPSGPGATQVKAESQRMLSACGPILSRLPASARQNPPVTPAELQQFRLYARCIRQHGIPGFPDPRPDGTFPLTGTQKAQLNGPAAHACNQYTSGGKG